MVHLSAFTKVMAQLQGATNVGADDDRSTGFAEIVCLDSTKLGRLLWLHQVVNPCAATADASFHSLPQLQLGDSPQQLTWLGLDALSMDHVAGVMHGHGGL